MGKDCFLDGTPIEWDSDIPGREIVFMGPVDDSELPVINVGDRITDDSIITVDGTVIPIKIIGNRIIKDDKP